MAKKREYDLRYTDRFGRQRNVVRVLVDRDDDEALRTLLVSLIVQFEGYSRDKALKELPKHWMDVCEPGSAKPVRRFAGAQ
jgi:hypothetical protein